jgi:uncharacterized protein YqeY
MHSREAHPTGSTLHRPPATIINSSYTPHPTKLVILSAAKDPNCPPTTNQPPALTHRSASYAILSHQPEEKMSYIDRIQSDLTAAMKEKDELRLSVLRMVKSALKHKEIEKMRPLDDLESLQVLQTLVKQRHESAEQFTKGGRFDLAEKEKKEIAFIEHYLPAAPTDDELRRAIDEAVDEQSADSLKHMGAVIKAARARLEGKAIDGKALSDKVRDRLTPKS